MGGDGGYGGNGSVYLQNNFGPTGNPKTTLNGYDPTPAGSISGGQGHFRVILRFSTASGKTKAQLIAEVQSVANRANAAINQLNAPAATEASLMIQVPAIPRAAKPAGPPGDPYEVFVDW